MNTGATMMGNSSEAESTSAQRIEKLSGLAATVLSQLPETTLRAEQKPLLTASIACLLLCSGLATSSGGIALPLEFTIDAEFATGLATLVCFYFLITYILLAYSVLVLQKYSRFTPLAELLHEGASVSDTEAHRIAEIRERLHQTREKLSTLGAQITESDAEHKKGQAPLEADINRQRREVEELDRSMDELTRDQQIDRRREFLTRRQIIDVLETKRLEATDKHDQTMKDKMQSYRELIRQLESDWEALNKSRAAAFVGLFLSQFHRLRRWQLWTHVWFPIALGWVAVFFGAYTVVRHWP